MPHTTSRKLLCLIGPTGTGKTALAVKLGKLFPSVLISADSRQVYKGMDIVTGKDHPASTPLFGVDLVTPDVPCSVSVWHDAVYPVIQKAWEDHKLPVVVGGTGLYVKSLLAPISSLHIPPNNVLRTKLNKLSLFDLQSRLQSLSPTKYIQMNHSDQNNPRRLIRAIEIALAPIRPNSEPLSTSLDPLLVGLNYSPATDYRAIILSRVKARLDHGAIAETSTLLSCYPDNLPSFTALGYQPIVKYLKGNLSQPSLISLWASDEYRYSKRQLTFFRSLPNVAWFSPDSPDFLMQVEKLVSTWYYGHKKK